jgi:predicted RNA methylase
MRAILLTAILLTALFSSSAGPQQQSDDWTRSPDVVYVGTPYDVASRMLKMAEVKKDDLVYDLGCGDGRILILAAQKYGSRAVGFDIDPIQVRAARENVKRNGVEDLVTIIQADVLTLDLSKADVITTYLLPELNQLLIPQLEKLKPGSRIVCHDYDIQGIVPDESVTMISNEDNARHIIWRYTAPLKKE